MKEYQKLTTMIHEFYGYKDSLESLLQSHIFDETIREKIHNNKEQCMQSLLSIFSFAKQETYHVTIRHLGAELIQAISLFSKNETILFDELLSLSNIVQRMEKEIFSIVWKDQQETRAILDRECMNLTADLRKTLGIPAYPSFFSLKKVFLRPRMYSNLSQDALDTIVADIDIFLSSSLCINHDIQQSSYHRLPDFFVQLKKIIVGITRDRLLLTQKHSFLDRVDVNLDQDNTNDENVSELKKTDYLYRLTADRENVLANLAISDEITETNYKDVLDEYEDHIFSYNKNKQLHNMLNARIRKYKAYCFTSKASDRRWEALLYVQSLLKREVKEEVDGFQLHQQEQIKRKEEEQELLRNQSIHFPKIISLLRKFKKRFASEYFSKSPLEVREAFVEQYTSLVLDPVVKINPELLSLSDRESRALQHTHRKIELYKNIPSIISQWSDDLIAHGISKWFIFGEIDDLIQFMQKTYKENIVV